MKSLRKKMKFRSIVIVILFGLVNLMSISRLLIIMIVSRFIILFRRV